MSSMKHIISGHYFSLPREWNFINVVRNLASLSDPFLIGEKTKPWFKFIYQSEIPHRQSDFLRKPPYKYNVYYRQSKDRALILSEIEDVIKPITSFFIKNLSVPSLSTIRIDVNGLVNKILDEPKEYVVNSIHAKTTGFGASLQSISFYGKDITKVSIFRDNKEKFLCHMCGLRKLTSRIDAVRIGNEGQVQTYYGSLKNLRAIEEVLGYITDEGFLPDYPKVEEGI